MATKLQIWNRALAHLGEGRLVSTTPATDGTEPAYVFEEIWPTVALDGLARGDWNFAIKTVQVTKNPSPTLIPGFQFQFDYPTDWVRTVAYNFEADFTDISFHYDHLDVYTERGAYFSNSELFFLRYVSSDYVDDANLGDYPPSYVEFIACLLAEMSAERLTQGTNQQLIIEKQCKRLLLKAKSNDARNVKTQRIRTGRWLRAWQGDADRRGSIGTIVGGEIDTEEGET
ncbi:MAG: hypothetical protein OES69_04355 [Myxococcales bacterium]|nr:hypothetical protein [Myxococcales bacterium]